jgi:CarS bacterial SH3 domain
MFPNLMGLLDATPMRTRIRHATTSPFRVGQPVRITGLSTDDTFDERFLDAVGLVTGLIYDTPDVKSPMIQVDVPGLGEDVFFPEELTPNEDRQHRASSKLRRRST